jgi:hypothetical protein
MPQRDPLQSDRSPEPEPPSRSPLLFIGRNRRGSWVVLDQSGMRGGLFVSRAEALRYAMFEADYRPQAIVMAAGFLELDLRSSMNVPANSTGKANRASIGPAACPGSVRRLPA